MNSKGRKMLVIPYGNIQIKSALKKDEIENRLRKQLEPQQLVSGFFRGEHKYFEGELKNGQFKINPIIEIRNSFNPVITGMIQQETDCTVVNMSVRLHFIVAIMFLSFLSGLFSIFILPEISLFFDAFVFGEGRTIYETLPQGHFLQAITFFVVSASMLYFFVIIPFNIEVNKVTKHLEYLFAGKAHIISSE
jgi:hypothetical protein